MILHEIRIVAASDLQRRKMKPKNRLISMSLELGIERESCPLSKPSTAYQKLAPSLSLFFPSKWRDLLHSHANVKFMILLPQSSVCFYGRHVTLYPTQNKHLFSILLPFLSLHMCVGAIIYVFSDNIIYCNKS